MMMTLHKLSVRDGYSYLSREVASADTQRSRGWSLSDYYLETGDAPGRWLGAGAADLGVRGEVTEVQMKALFKYGAHPDRERVVDEHVAAGRSASSGEAAAQLGRRFPSFAGPNRRAVAGYDLVFGPVKSVSLLWAFGGEHIRREVEAAHQDALTDVLSWLEHHAVFTRTGRPPRHRVPTHGLICAAFDHRDSRTGDPDLHTHVAVSNKVRAVGDHPDGRPRYLALDGSVLFAAARAASERYLTRAEDQLATRLGVQFAPRTDCTHAGQRVVREVVGVPEELIRHFSRRRNDIKAMHAELLTSYRTTYGRRASATMEARLAQIATLATRPDKLPPRSLEAQIEDWTHQASAVIGERRVQVIQDVVGRAAPSSAGASPDELARATLNALENTRATWTRWDTIAEVERQTRALRPASPGERDQLVTSIVERVLSPAATVRLGPSHTRPGAGGDEQPVLQATTLDTSRYTTPHVLDAEAGLLAAALEGARTAVTPEVAACAVEDHQARSGSRLDPDQIALAVALASVDRRLVAGIAGSSAGKTAALRAACHVWDDAGVRVVPLATSSASATILGHELGRRADSLYEFLDHLDSPRQADPQFHRLSAGDVVLVDEAGMAGTLPLARLLGHARAADASIRLVADPTQLAAHESGAVLRLVTSEIGGLPLSALHHLQDPAYARAARQLHAGDATCLDYYADDVRLRTGTRTAMLDAACQAWEHDVRAGLTSMIICPSTKDASALAGRARTARVQLGAVDVRGVELADGNRASAGDWVVTDAGQRTLITCGGRDFVKSGDPWTVVHRHLDDSLTVRHQRHRGQLTLPGDYVREHVRLAYALTAQRSHSVSVETAHPVLVRWTSREALYLAATRGRLATTVYVGMPSRTDEPPGQTASSDRARGLLASIIAQPVARPDASSSHEALGGRRRDRLREGAASVRGRQSLGTGLQSLR